MKVGISVASLVDLAGVAKQIDGIGVYTSQLMAALPALDVQPVSVYFGGLGCKPAIQPQDMLVGMHPAISQFLPFNCYRRLENQINIFHSTDYMIPHLRHVPVIATLYDAIKFKHADWASQQSRYFKNYLLRRMARYAQHVITISEAVKQDIIEYFGIPEAKISVVYCGLDKVWYAPYAIEERQQVLQKYGIKKKYVLTVGTLQARKNIARILDVCEALPVNVSEDLVFIFVGKRGWLEADVFERMQRLIAIGRIKWLQYVTFDELRCLYQSANMVLYPSLSEGFGLPVLEGFASAVPVITSNEGSLAEVAGDAALLVDPYSVADVLAAVLRLYEDNALKQSLVIKGLHQAKKFSWQKMAQDIKEIYVRFVNI